MKLYIKVWKCRKHSKNHIGKHFLKEYKKLKGDEKKAKINTKS